MCLLSLFFKVADKQQKRHDKTLKKIHLNLFLNFCFTPQNVVKTSTFKLQSRYLKLPPTAAIANQATRKAGIPPALQNFFLEGIYKTARKYERGYTENIKN